MPRASPDRTPRIAGSAARCVDSIPCSRRSTFSCAFDHGGEVGRVVKAHAGDMDHMDGGGPVASRQQHSSNVTKPVLVLSSGIRGARGTEAAVLLSGRANASTISQACARLCIDPIPSARHRAETLFQSASFS